MPSPWNSPPQISFPPIPPLELPRSPLRAPHGSSLILLSLSLYLVWILGREQRPPGKSGSSPAVGRKQRPPGKLGSSSAMGRKQRPRGKPGCPHDATPPMGWRGRRRLLAAVVAGLTPWDLHLLQPQRLPLHLRYNFFVFVLGFLCEPDVCQYVLEGERHCVDADMSTRAAPTITR